MALFTARSDKAPKQLTPVRAGPPLAWPVDPGLARRVAETRARLESTRRQLALHVLPDRKRSKKSSVVSREDRRSRTA